MYTLLKIIESNTFYPTAALYGNSVDRDVQHKILIFGKENNSKKKFSSNTVGLKFYIFKYFNKCPIKD